ncbi:MAG TPA: ComF family protein [Vicinamibacterales bacterium]|nr:ComF family protein [Vicinamibacterales bacterium]
MLDTPLSGPVCPACWSGVRRVASPVFDGCAVACEYEGPLRDILHAFKYDGRRSLAAPLGTLLRDAGGPVLAGADAVVPVPLHPWKRLRRGFNQSADLARTLGVPVRPVLWRSRATRAQAGLTPSQRRRNVAGAFALVPWPRRASITIEQQILVLVDDVMTTGATLDACARVLQRAGAREVRMLALARALPPAAGITRP